MPRHPPLAAALQPTPDDVEAQFYEALRQGDLARLMDVWADDDEIVCVHPGGTRLIGAAAIRESYAAVFANGVVPVEPQQVRRLLTLGSAVHHLVERIGVPGVDGVQHASVLATNVYVKTAQGWRLVAHHASPGSAAVPPTGPEPVSATLSAAMEQFRSPLWLPGGDLQTIWPALFSRRPLPPGYRRERWDTPDGDFIDVDHVDGPPGAPGLVLFHGLEGSSQSRYALGMAEVARRRGWSYSVPHFRGCSGELNRAPRAYHSGDFEEIGWILQRLRARHTQPLLAVGVSLGGNALLRWAEEAGTPATATTRAIASVSAPLDLAASGHAIDSGFNWLAYSRMFLRTMKPKALAKWLQYPGLFDRERLAAVRTLYAFDDVFTAPLHGFRDAGDYWTRASAKPHLASLRVPTLLLNARNDPFVPAASLPRQQDATAHVTLWQPGHGGHVGFPGRAPALPDALADWLASA